MKNLFRTIFAIVAFCIITESSAQISVGPGIAYGTDIDNIGFSLNGKYEFNNQWAAAPSFTYFLKKDYVTWSSLDLNINYQITNIENIGELYGIGGLSITFWGIDGKELSEDLYEDEYEEYDGYDGYDGYYGYDGYDGYDGYYGYDGYQDSGDMWESLDTNTTEIGVNLGLGLNIEANEKMTISPEINYTLGGVNYLRIGVKAMFNL